MNRPRIIDRIRAAFGPEERELHFDDLARRIFPDSKSWRYAAHGGPPGCYMTLSAALRRHGIGERWDGPGQRFVRRPKGAPHA
ncbi:MAG: hypothetical protein ACOC91_00085 [bacterium]